MLGTGESETCEVSGTERQWTRCRLGVTERQLTSSRV